VPELSDIDGKTLLGALSAAVLVLAMWGIGVLVWSMRRQRDEELMRARLDSNLGDAPRTLRLWHEGVASTVLVPGLKRGLGLTQHFERLHRDLGWIGSWQRTLSITALLIAGVSLLVANVSGNNLNGLFAAVLMVFGVYWFAGFRRSSREALFERQLVDGLELSARALRSGHPLLSSFKLIAEEIDDPVGRIFGDICQQHEMGVNLDRALRDAADATSSADMRLFSASLAIHLRSGGNIADVVEGIAQVIRQRMRLARRVRILTAQTQLSKRILLGMPVAIFAALHILNPDYAKILYETDSGKLMLLGALSMMLVGWLTMNRMAVVRM
jgi:tight adherence protein B